MAIVKLYKGRVLPDSCEKVHVYEMIESATVTVTNIVNADVNGSATVVDTKLSTISTGSKVRHTALSCASAAAGDLLYWNGSAFVRLPIGTDGQKLKTDFDSYTKLMLHCDGADGGTTITDACASPKTLTNTEAVDSYTKFLCHFDGANGATSASVVTGQTITFLSGGVLSTGQKKFGTASLLLSAGAHASVPDNANWNLGSGDWEISCFARYAVLPTNTNQGIFRQMTDDSNGHEFKLVDDADGNKYYLYNIRSAGAGVVTLQTTTGVPEVAADTWYHYAVTHSGTTYFLFIDGVCRQSSTIADYNVLDYTSTACFGLDMYEKGLKGYLDEFRISKGDFRWNKNFTSPSYAYGQVVTDTSNAKFSSSSAYFDGAGCDLTLADSADWDWGNSNFSVDGQVKFQHLPWGTNYQAIFSQWLDSDNRKEFYFATPTTAYFYSTLSGNVQADYGFTLPLTLSTGSFYHFELSRSSSALHLFINGISGTYTAGQPLSTNALGDLGAVMYIGMERSGSVIPLRGWLDELRISKGICRHNANFTAPTSAYAPDLRWVT